MSHIIIFLSVIVAYALINTVIINRVTKLNKIEHKDSRVFWILFFILIQSMSLVILGGNLFGWNLNG